MRDDLTDLKTDSTGHVHLLYWTPGGIVKAHTTVVVEAETTCSPTSCSSGRQTGSADVKLTVKPYPIYHSHGTLSEETVRYLIGIVRDRGLAIFGSAAAHRYLEVQLHWLAAEEVVAQRAVQIVAGPLGYGVILGAELGVAIHEFQEEKGIIAGFLKALDLQPTGLDDEPFQRQIPGGINGAFAQLMLSGAANVGHFLAGGFCGSWDKC